MSCESMQRMAEAQEVLKRAKKAKTTEERKKIDKELDGLDICVEVKEHIREHLYAGVAMKLPSHSH